MRFLGKVAHKTLKMAKTSREVQMIEVLVAMGGRKDVCVSIGVNIAGLPRDEALAACDDAASKIGYGWKPIGGSLSDETG